MKSNLLFLLCLLTTGIFAQSFDELPGVKKIQALSEDELIERVRKCRPADLCDAMDAFGLINIGTMSHRMRPIRPGINFAGFAYTVKFIPAAEPAGICNSPEEYFERLSS